MSKMTCSFINPTIYQCDFIIYLPHNRSVWPYHSLSVSLRFYHSLSSLQFSLTFPTTDLTTSQYDFSNHLILLQVSMIFPNHWSYYKSVFFTHYWIIKSALSSINLNTCLKYDSNCWFQSVWPFHPLNSSLNQYGCFVLAFVNPQTLLQIRLCFSCYPIDIIIFRSF